MEMEKPTLTNPIPISPQTTNSTTTTTNTVEISCTACCFKLKLPWKLIRKNTRNNTHHHHRHNNYSSSMKRKFMPTTSSSCCSNSISDVTAALYNHVQMKNSKPRNNNTVFKYDPLSYAQNFDDGCCGMEGSSYDRDEYYSRGFTSRFAAPSPASAAAAVKSSPAAVV